MISKSYKCHDCNSSNIVKNGKEKNGAQKYKCKDCGKTRVLEYKPTYTEEQKEIILKAYMERSSIRGICRIFGCAKQTLSNWLKKKPKIFQTI
jgi:insertion element IS1 protein InsB